MPYQIKYRVDVEYVGVGVGGAGNPPAAQKLTFVQSTANTFASQSPLGGAVAPGGGAGGALVTGDITTLLAALSTDLTAQMNTPAQLAQMAAWATTGGG